MARRKSGRGGQEKPKSDGRREGKPSGRGAMTRARLLEAARHLFTQRGYDETSMIDIAERVGVGVGTVYHHFRDKRALLLELVDLALDRMAQRRADLPLVDLFEGGRREAGRKIERWLRGAYEHLSKHPTLNLVLLAQSGSDPELRLRKERSDRLRVERLSTLIAFGQQRGVMRRDCDPMSAAFLLHHAVQAVAMELLVREVRDPNPDVVLAELGGMVTRFLLQEEPSSEEAPSG